MAYERKPSKSGSFTNLQDYIDANRGNSGAFADRTIDTLEGNVGSARDTAQSEIDDYKDQVTAGTVTDNEELRNRSLTDIANDPDRISQYQEGLNASYGGPDSFVSDRGFSDLDQARGVVDRTNTFAGTESALKDTYGRQGGYTGGESELDTTLLTRPKENRERFSQLRNRVTDSVDKFETDTKDNTQAWAEAAKRTTDATRQAYRDDIAADQAALDQSIQNTVDATNRQRQAEYGSVFQAENFNPENKPVSGWEQLVAPVRRSDYSSYGGALTANQAMTDQQRAQYQALTSILGDTVTDGNTFINPYTAEAGPIRDAVNFNQATYDQAIRDQNIAINKMKTDYGNAIKDAAATWKTAAWDPNRLAPPNPHGDKTYQDLVTRYLSATNY